ncbi:GILT-like protein 2 [Spodoptera litura]|uniref:GILT-like protein 2 n=1 Tax=Spodoptera litura TaxID=69820 RepID=A0A9J7EIR0_SPOLT|nr:GILT-like protein 2 [Spodoptera litura]
MAAKYIILFSACFVLASSQSTGLQTVNGRIKVSVGLTSSESEVSKFINNQLVPAVEAYGKFLDIEFVPWGRTTWVNNVIQCNSGHAECWANRLHRCVLDKLKNDQAAQLHYMACEFSAPYPSYLQGSYICAQAVGLNLLDVDYCVANPGDELDRAAQEAASVPMAQFQFIPYIVFNEAINVDLHEEGLVRLPNLICWALSEDSSTGVTSCHV